MKKNQAGTVLVVGATSAVARALAIALAQRGVDLVLAARDVEEVERIASDLVIRYRVKVQAISFEALQFEKHPTFFARCVELAEGDRKGVLQGVVLCHGCLPDQAATEENFAAAQRAIDVNFTSVVSLLNLAADYFQERRAGFIAAVSSVAGDRGRQSNYTYGAAKGALTAYLAGMRNRLHNCGVQVTTIKPGFIDTPMTHGLLNPASPLVASPEHVAKDILSAIDRKRDVIYTPWFWRWLMLLICAIPERLFKRMRL